MERKDSKRYMFIICWILGFDLHRDPAVMRIDQEPGFSARQFRKLATTHEIKLQFSEAQSHNDTESGKTYY